jgi:hypothetical protein
LTHPILFCEAESRNPESGHSHHTNQLSDLNLAFRLPQSLDFAMPD